MMEYDIHTLLDALTLGATLWVIYVMKCTPVRTTYQSELDTVPWWQVAGPCCTLALLAHPTTQHWLIFRARCLAINRPSRPLPAAAAARAASGLLCSFLPLTPAPII